MTNEEHARFLRECERAAYGIARPRGDAFADRAARIARDHADATARAASESADLLDSMRLAGFTFASDDRATVAATLATVAPKGGADLA